ncbi:MAG: hypothetical protein CSA22_09235 [Deltaproteobacteria bacterium]|nr:MAG: hypothetical protein CSA22_09235 [Deltaproteobacteria bacterium]
MAETIAEAIEKIRHYIKETKGVTVADKTIARALTRYFVLKEIADHIAIERGPEGDTAQNEH